MSLQGRKIHIKTVQVGNNPTRRLEKDNIRFARQASNDVQESVEGHVKF